MVTPVSIVGEEERVPEESPTPVADWQTNYVPEGWEAQVMGKHHNLFAAIKTLESFIPFGKMMGLTPSGQAEWKAQSTKEKIIDTALDALVITPLPWLGKGFKAAAKLAGFGKVFTPKKFELQALDKLNAKIAPYVERSGDDVLLKDFLLTQEELGIVKAGRIPLGTPVELSEKLGKIIDPEYWKAGEIRLKDSIQRKVNAANRAPNVKMFDHYEQQFEQAAKAVWGKDAKGLLAKDNRNRTFNVVAETVLGPDIAKGITLDAATPELMANIAAHMLDTPRKFKRMIALGTGSILPSLVTPPRFIFGAQEKMFGMFRGVYETGKGAFLNSNKYTFDKINLFNSLLADRGLGTIRKTKTGDFRFKLAKEAREDSQTAANILVEIGEKTFAGDPEDTILSLYRAQNDNVRKFMDTWFEWTDQLYKEHVEYSIPQIFKDMGTSPVVQTLADKLLRKDDGVKSVLSRAFAPVNDQMVFGKAQIVAEQLSRFQLLVRQLQTQGMIDGDTAVKLVNKLSFKSKENPQGFVNYLENYVTRIYEAQAGRNITIASSLGDKRMAAFYTKLRREPRAEDLVKDLGTLVERRASAQGKELMFYPVLPDIAKFLKEKGVPQAQKEFTAHWTFRMLGQPSPADVKVAHWLEATYGKVEEILGLESKGLWNADRVRHLGQNINNLVYLGGLGFRPFAAFRNLTQGLLLVPADLGGATNIGWYVKGIRNATNPKVRAYIRDELKAIEEYAPELHLRARAVGVGKKIELGGKSFTLPETQQVRDVGLWLFKLSDRFTRYSTGATAMAKWDHYAAKLFNRETGIAAPLFSKKMNTQGRNKWVSSEIEGLLKEGGEANFQEAKKLFVNDVISNTQFLYGTADSPILGHTWGAPGKMALVFQSWWMNYAKELESWMRTGTAGDKAKRLFTFMLSAAIAEQLMEPLWGRATAGRTVGFGPFPGEISEFSIPPAYAPVYHALGTMVNLGKLDTQGIERHWKQLLRSGSMFVPGGIQIAQTMKPALEGDLPGIAKSIVRYHQDKDYKPLWGLLK